LSNSVYLEPIARAVTAVVAQAKLAHTLQSATTALAGQTPLLLLAQKVLPPQPNVQHAVNELIRRQKSLEVWAKEVQNNSNHDINLPALINVWVTVEALCEDLCVAIISNDASALINLKQINTKIDEGMSITDESARSVYEQSLLKIKKHGLVHGYLTIFTALGFSPTLSDACVDRLNELNYLRNCSLHRAGIVEPRKDKEAPSFPVAVGERILVTDELFTRLYDSVSEFLQALIPSLTKSGHLK
jgi:hypothetical protein